MKLIMKTIFLILVLVSLTIAVLANQAFRLTYEAPQNTYNGTFDFYYEVTKKVNAQILNIVTSTKEVSLDEDFLNKALAKDLEENNYYTNEMTIVGKTQSVKIDNLWTTIESDFINIYGTVNINNKFYSSLKLRLKVTTDEENVIIELQKAEIGNIKLSSKDMIRVLEVTNLDEKVNTTYDFGTVDLDNYTVKVTKEYINKKLAEQISTDVILIDDIKLVEGEIQVTFKINPSSILDPFIK